MAEADECKSDITLIGVEKKKDGYIAYRIPLDKSFQPEVEKSALAAISETDKITNKFDPDNDLAKVPFVADKDGDDIWDDSLMTAIEDYLNLPALNGKEFGKKKFFATVVALNNDTGTWMLINKRDVQHVGNRGIPGRFGRENRITRIEYPIYIFSDSYHVIEHDDKYYVNLYNSFDKLFREPTDLKPKVKKMASRVSVALELTDESTEELIEIASRKKSIANKLDSLNRHIDQINPTSAKVKKALTILHKNTDEYYAGDKLNFTQNNTEDLLRILNEDRFLGLISGIAYTADRKTTEG